MEFSNFGQLNFGSVKYILSAPSETFNVVNSGDNVINSGDNVVNTT